MDAVRSAPEQINAVRPRPRSSGSGSTSRRQSLDRRVSQGQDRVGLKQSPRTAPGVVRWSWACVSTPTTNANDLPTLPTATTLILKRQTNRDPLIKRRRPTTQTTPPNPTKPIRQHTPPVIQPRRNQPTPRRRRRPIRHAPTRPTTHHDRRRITRPQPFGLIRHAATHQRDHVFPSHFFHTRKGKKWLGKTAALIRRRA